MNTKYKKNIPSCITMLRILLSISLLFIDVFNFKFYSIYILGGITDVLDGFLARKFNVSSNIGSLLDTIADFIMTLVLFIILSPIIKVPKYVVIWVIVIAVIRLVSILLSLIKYKEFAILHTISNKITGLSLYLLVIFLDTSIASKLMAFVCIIATISSIEELCVHITSKKLDRNRKSIIKCKG